MSRHSEDAQTFATVALKSIDKERNTQSGRIFAHVTGEMLGGGSLYDGLVHLGDTVYRLGMTTEGDTLYGVITEHRTVEKQKQDFIDDLAAAGLTPEKADAARREVLAAAKEAKPPREITVKSSQLEAIAEKLESGQCDAGLKLIKRLLIT